MDAALTEKDRYTYSDYCNWPEDEHWELINGAAYAKAAPSLGHHSVVKKLFRQLDAFLADKPCEVFFAPVAVRLDTGAEDTTVVEPDIFVVCDESKIKDGKSVVGAPDFVAEIMSPSTAKHDRVTKLNLYRRSGVREYSIVDPDSKIVAAHTLHGDKNYVIRAYDEQDAAVPVEVLDGCLIDLTDVFE